MKKLALRWFWIVTIMALFTVTGVLAQEMTTHHHPDMNNNTGESEITQDWAKDRLAKSPRHREWVRKWIPSR